MATRKRYLCVGGPLAGQRASSDDFEGPSVSLGPTSWRPSAPPKGTIERPAGRFHEHAAHYWRYNNAGGRSRNEHGPLSMIWVHEDVLRG